jgi:MFS family permease
MLPQTRPARTRRGPMRQTPTSTDPTAAPRPPKLFTSAFATLAVASLAYFTSVGMLIPSLPRYVVGPLGGGDVAVGIVFGTFSISAVLLRPFAGVFGDRRGRRPLMLLGAVVCAASVLLYGVAPSWAALAAIRLLSGAGEALFFVGMATTFTDLAPDERRGEAMSLASLALYLGIGIGPILAEGAMAVAGFAVVWVGSAGLALIAAGLVLRVPETRVAEGPGFGDHDAGNGAVTHRWVHPAGLLPGVVLFASIVGMAGFLAFVPLHVLDIGMGGAGIVLAVFASVVVLIRSLGARLPDLLGHGRAIRSALLLSTAGLSVAATWQAPIGLVAGAVVLGVGIALLTPSVFAMAVADVPPNERGQVMATTSAFIDIAFGAGPLLLGLVAAAYGRPAVFVAGALVAALGWILMVTRQVGRRPSRHRLAEGGAS